jgi:hypothetical protein
VATGTAAVAELSELAVDDDALDAVDGEAVEDVAALLAAWLVAVFALRARQPVSTSIAAALVAPATTRARRAGCGRARRVGRCSWLSLIVLLSHRRRVR